MRSARMIPRSDIFDACRWLFYHSNKSYNAVTYVTLGNFSNPEKFEWNSNKLNHEFNSLHSIGQWYAYNLLIWYNRIYPIPTVVKWMCVCINISKHLYGNFPAHYVGHLLKQIESSRTDTVCSRRLQTFIWLDITLYKIQTSKYGLYHCLYHDFINSVSILKVGKIIFSPVYSLKNRVEKSYSVLDTVINICRGVDVQRLVGKILRSESSNFT